MGIANKKEIAGFNRGGIVFVRVLFELHEMVSLGDAVEMDGSRRSSSVFCFCALRRLLGPGTEEGFQ